MRTSIRVTWLGILLGFPVLVAACRGEGPPAEEVGRDGQDSSAGADPGALIRAEMGSVVGVLLDEIPAGPMREAAATEALLQSEAFWLQRATSQVKLTYYKLV